MSEQARDEARSNVEERRRWVVGAFVFQGLFLALAAVRNLGALNTDAIAYLRIAEYYADWNPGLMVSGYWGPLLSWLMVPFIKVGLDPIVSARVAMAISGVVFLLGCRAVYRACELESAISALGIWVAAVFSIFWSVRHITPDLLLAGLMAFAIANTVDRQWLTTTRAAALAGGSWGAAYLAKAIAFPLAGLVTLAAALLHARTGRIGFKTTARQVGITWLAFGIIAAPWALVLSLKYGGPTFSTSGRINHAIAGPADVERYHPFARELHIPEPGRVTQWEDPSEMEYQFWSPFESGESLRHQAGIVLENAPKVLTYLAGFNLAHLLGAGGELRPRDLLILVPGFDLFYLGFLGLVGCVALRSGWREHFGRERWRWAVLPVCLMAGLYLPVYLRSDDLRYFYPAFPLVWVAAAGTFSKLSLRLFGDKNRARRWTARCLGASFGFAGGVWLLVALAGLPNAGNAFARQLASRMEESGMAGSIAGSATLQGGRAGLYTAFHLGEPWLGDSESAAAPEFAEAGADIVVLTSFDPRNSSLEGALFEDVTPRLFSNEEVERFPLRVFRRRRQR